jgi:hypothetical protein
VENRGRALCGQSTVIHRTFARFALCRGASVGGVRSSEETSTTVSSILFATFSRSGRLKVEGWRLPVTPLASSGNDGVEARHDADHDHASNNVAVRER